MCESYDFLGILVVSISMDSSALDFAVQFAGGFAVQFAGRFAVQFAGGFAMHGGWVRQKQENLWFQLEFLILDGGTGGAH